MKKPTTASNNGKSGMCETLKEIERLEQYPVAREVDIDVIIESSSKPSDARTRGADSR